MSIPKPLSVLLGTAFLGMTVVSFAGDAIQDWPRRALILANDAYAHSPLRNPPNDAALMGKTLQQLGFDVTLGQNLNRDELFRTTTQFAEALPNNAVALVFYAGHGIQVNRHNYLIPVDMVPTSEQSVPLKAFPVQNLLDHLDNAASSVNIVILDACRNNPFYPQSHKAYRNFDNLGLTEMALPKGTVIAYSTAPNQLAADGGDANSLYTQTLAKQLMQSGITLEQALKNVALQIRKTTLDDQQPWYESSLVNDFYLIPPAPGALVAKPPVADDTSETDVLKRDSDWLASFSTQEWDDIAINISQRASHLTLDEIPDFKKRALQGNVIAMTTLGLAYRDGFFIGNVDHAAKTGASNPNSLHWLRRAALSDFPIAQYHLAESYFHGLGVPVNVAEGMRWLNKARAHHYRLAEQVYADRLAKQQPSQNTMTQAFEQVLTDGKALQQRQLERIKALAQPSDSN